VIRSSAGTSQPWGDDGNCRGWCTFEELEEVSSRF